MCFLAAMMAGAANKPKQPDPLAGFVAPTRNIVNPFVSRVTRYEDLESEQDYMERNRAAKRAFNADPANAGKTYVNDARRHGGRRQERLSDFRQRQKDERAAFDASDLGKANESEADYKARVAAAQQEYISRQPAASSAATSASSATGATSVASKDRIATKLKQKTAQRASRASSGRAMLRIGR